MNEEDQNTMNLLNLVCEGVELPTDEQERETVDSQDLQCGEDFLMHGNE